MAGYLDVARTLWNTPGAAGSGATPAPAVNPSVQPADTMAPAPTTPTPATPPAASSVTPPAAPAAPPVKPMIPPAAPAAPAPVTPAPTAQPQAMPSTPTAPSGQKAWYERAYDTAKEKVIGLGDQVTGGAITNAGVQDSLNKSLEGLDNVAKQPAFMDDFFGWAKDNWGAVAGIGGLLMMLFGNNTMKLMGAVASIAGGFNIYNRVQNLMGGKYNDEVRGAFSYKNANGVTDPMAYAVAQRDKYFTAGNKAEGDNVYNAIRDATTGVQLGFYDTARNRLIAGHQDHMKEKGLDPNTLQIPAVNPEIQGSWRNNFVSKATTGAQDLFGQVQDKAKEWMSSPPTAQPPAPAPGTK